MLRIYVESVLKFQNNQAYCGFIMPAPGKESKIVSTLIKTFNDSSSI